MTYRSRDARLLIRGQGAVESAGCSAGAHPYRGSSTPHKPKHGQGAMEYLTTYGWAILVVMIVGGAMWRLGVLNIGGSIPTTSSGFSAIKPLLPTCRAGNNDVGMVNDGSNDANGFTCDFMNGAGENIMVTNAAITLNGKNCELLWLGNNINDPKYLTLWPLCQAEEYDMFTSCDASGCGGDFGSGVCWYPDDAGNSILPVKAGSTFTAQLIGYTCQNPPATGGWNCACGGLKPGDPYTANVDIIYEVTLGGQKVVKHSAGTIRGSAE